MKPRIARIWLLGAVLVGLCARVPGIFWGANFPGGWYGHHVDEYTHLVNAERIINPTLPPRWPPHPYPNGMAAHAAAPLIAWKIASGGGLGTLPPHSAIIVTGRIVSVLYGAASILILFLLISRLIADLRVATLSAWFLALGGLHVTQSHFFLSDIASLFWLLAGLYLLLRDLEMREPAESHWLYAAATSFGIAFGLKLLIYSLPSLGLAVLWRRPRLPRMIISGAFFLVGYVLVTLGSFDSFSLAKAFIKGVGDPYHFSALTSMLLYLVEFPSVVSFPFLALAVIGGWLLVRKLGAVKDFQLACRTAIVFLLPLLMATLFVVFKLDHFPRHLILFIPWMAVAAAWGLLVVADPIARNGVPRAVIVAPVFLYLAMFVYDGERLFIDEPRNRAAQWVLYNAAPGATMSWTHHNWFPGYHGFRYVEYPGEGRPDFIVTEMHTANHYLSGMSWKDSYPSDYRKIFASQSQRNIESLQALFRGKSEYREVARFPDAYFMPEYRLADNLIGNRSRNYLAEIVVFSKARHSYRNETTGNKLP